MAGGTGPRAPAKSRLVLLATVTVLVIAGSLARWWLHRAAAGITQVGHALPAVLVAYDSSITATLPVSSAVLLDGAQVGVLKEVKTLRLLDRRFRVYQGVLVGAHALLGDDSARKLEGVVATGGPTGAITIRLRTAATMDTSMPIAALYLDPLEIAIPIRGE